MILNVRIYVVESKMIRKRYIKKALIIRKLEWEYFVSDRAKHKRILPGIKRDIL